ncbi:CNNM domain-containing protein, partial [Stieleria sp.]|uniref:CNNM domain-containing protein n=1 Tax=Stieleria sp. TaxID=2795976 RepID=UPI00356841E5
MTLPVVLFLVGLMLSAFFSGSETGLYRVSRTRLVLDGLSGSWAARGIVWLLNHPAIFVATTLVGNNLANYLTSLAVVMAVAVWFHSSETAELLGPMLMTPVVFVFGESLPKYLFFHAPHRLLTAARPFLLAAAVLFAPVSLLLGLLGRGLQQLTGQTPFRVRLAMARGELDQVLRDGHEAGILAAGQRSLAQRLFEVGNQSAISFG